MKNKIERLAKEIYDWCIDNYLWGDSVIYFNGKAWSSSKEWGEVKGEKIGEELYEYMDKNPKDYFDYANEETLSMSFEGPLYDVLNANVPGWTVKENKFYELLKKYGYYYELGNAWNLSLYEN